MASSLEPLVLIIKKNHTKVYYKDIWQIFPIGSDQLNKMTTIVKTRTFYASSDSHLLVKIQNNYTDIIPVSRISMEKLIKITCITCGSRVISIFTKIPRPAKMMHGKVSSSFCIPVSEQYQNE